MFMLMCNYANFYANAVARTCNDNVGWCQKNSTQYKKQIKLMMWVESQYSSGFREIDRYQELEGKFRM